MSVLAYSELLKRITGIDEATLEKPYIILSRNTTTQKRLIVLKELAKEERATIGNLLQKCHINRGGGCYINIQRYFTALEIEGLLEKEIINNKSYWSFSKKYPSLKLFILK